MENGGGGGEGEGERGRVLSPMPKTFHRSLLEGGNFGWGGGGLKISVYPLHKPTMTCSALFHIEM